jgi:tetratricopeptide (TPR) repeat protein
MKKPGVLLLLLYLLGVSVFAQQKEEALAAEYYAGGEFAKAADIYEKLLKKDPSATYIYTSYLNSLLAMKDYQAAEKMVRSQAKRFPEDYNFKTDLVHVLKNAGQGEKAEKERQDLIREIRQPEQAHQLAVSFTRRDFWEAALESWLKGRKISGEAALFAREIAGAQARKGNKEEAIREIMLELLANPDSYREQQDFLSGVLTEKEDWELLKKELQKNSQKYPENEVFSEMLLWNLVQEKNFGAAFIYFRAMDKRKKEKGKRLLELAEICLDNGDFENALQCYNYIVGLGEGHPYFFQAQFGLLEVRYDKIVKYGRFVPQDLLDAEQEFKAFLSRFDLAFETGPAKRQLAHLYAFYLDKPDSAIVLLAEIISSPGSNARFRGEIKLELGDCYLMQGEVWDAELTYSQVDKDFKEDALGREAKFRMARLFYYKGEFERARAYLDVLKTATTQLIANDALELSMLILDNTGLDTTEEPLRLYSEADLLIFRNKVKEGLALLDELENTFPKGHPLADEILYARARAAIKMNLPDTAIAYLQAIVNGHAHDILADNALFDMAKLYEYQLNNPEKAMEYYEKLMLSYPGSLFSVEARKNYRRLRGDTVDDKKDNKQILFDRFTN